MATLFFFYFEGYFSTFGILVMATNLESLKARFEQELSKFQRLEKGYNFILFFFTCV